MPPAVNLAVKVLGNPSIERALRRAGASTLGCRRAFSVAGFLGSAAALLALAAARRPSPVFATAMWAAALGFVSLHPSGFKANYMDVASPAATGFVSGFGNTVGSTASLLSPLAVDLVLRTTGSWAACFALVAAANVAAAALFAAKSTASPVDVATPGNKGG